VSKHIGSSFDDFLQQEGSDLEVAALATKRVVAWQFSQAMQAENISKTALATRMRSSLVVVNRLLNESETNVTLSTMVCASVALGLQLRVELGAAGEGG
jgi:antitoxin HicB